jgi:TIR domain-containing protein
MAADEWDAFISHASEDKLKVVEPLVRDLQARELRIWYDKEIIRPGDSPRRAIDEGLRRSRVGIIVLSRSYFAKPWPQAEFDALYEQHLRGRSVLIPVRHGISTGELAEFSPLVSSLRSLSTDSGTRALAEELLVTIRRSWLHFASVEEVQMRPIGPSKAEISPERLIELRLSVIEELNELTATYITRYMENPQSPPTMDFFQRFLMITDRIRNLFSPTAFDAFKEVEVMIGPNLGPTGQGAVHRFIEARNAALAVLYREAGIGAA